MFKKIRKKIFLSNSLGKSEFAKQIIQFDKVKLHHWICQTSVHPPSRRRPSWRHREFRRRAHCWWRRERRAWCQRVRTAARHTTISLPSGCWYCEDAPSTASLGCSREEETSPVLTSEIFVEIFTFSSQPYFTLRLGLASRQLLSWFKGKDFLYEKDNFAIEFM